MFGDYYYKVHAASSTSFGSQYSGLGKNANAFELRRVYFGYNYNISERFTTQLLLAYENKDDNLGNGNRGFYLKLANIRWKNILPNTDIVAGQMYTPSFPLLSERIWAYRSIEKTAIDLRKFSVSNDVGIAMQTRFDSLGTYGMNVMIGNGTAAKIESNGFKKVYADFYANFLKRRLIFDLYGDWEKVLILPGYHKIKTTLKAFLAYQTDKFTIGIEVSPQIQTKYTLDSLMSNPTKIDTVNAIPVTASLYIRGTILKDKLGFFVRHDFYDPDRNYKKDVYYFSGYNNTEEMFGVAGIDFTPEKNIHIMPNIYFNQCTNKSSTAKEKAKTDFDLVPRITVSYLF